MFTENSKTGNNDNVDDREIIDVASRYMAHSIERDLSTFDESFTADKNLVTVKFLRETLPARFDLFESDELKTYHCDIDMISNRNKIMIIAELELYRIVW